MSIAALVILLSTNQALNHKEMVALAWLAFQIIVTSLRGEIKLDVFLLGGENMNNEDVSYLNKGELRTGRVKLTNRSYIVQGINWCEWQK